MNRLKKDNLFFGIVLGLVAPSVFFGILYAVCTLFAPEGKDLLIKLSTLLLVAIFPNLFLLRYYLKNLTFDKTGRGILLITFIWAIVYFILFFLFLDV